MFSYVDLNTPHANLLVGTQTLDDAGVYQLSPDTALIQTVDYFTPIVDDPFVFGQIAAANALSDVYAMGGVPITVLNIVGYPIAKLGPEILARILEGGASKVREAGATILGGHSIDDTDPKFGMAVTGVCHPEKIWTNAGAKPGDALILTKPLGVGIITTAIKRGLTSPEDEATVIQVMSELNKTAAEVAQGFSVHACTDVTGYGLLGHTWEMAKGAGVEIEIDVTSVPILEPAFALTEQGSVPGGSKRNRTHVEPHVTYSDDISEVQRTVLCDSITSGGLLLAVPDAEADSLVDKLHAAGLDWARKIGAVNEGSAHLIVDN